MKNKVLSTKQKIENYQVFYCQKTKIFRNFNPIFVKRYY